MPEPMLTSGWPTVIAPEELIEIDDAGLELDGELGAELAAEAPVERDVDLLEDRILGDPPRARVELVERQGVVAAHVQPGGEVGLAETKARRCLSRCMTSAETRG